VFGILTSVEDNPDRNSLDHLDVVARRILGRQQAVARAAGTGDVEDASVVIRLVPRAG
jgi:hypothetical protein